MWSFLMKAGLFIRDVIFLKESTIFFGCAIYGEACLFIGEG